MYKFLAIVAILGLTACRSKSTASTTADSTVAPITITADSVVFADSSVAAPRTGENAK